MSEEVSISKDAAVELLLQAGYEAFLEDGVVFVRWNDDIHLKETLKQFLRDHHYEASYGIKGRAKDSSPALALTNMHEIDPGDTNNQI